MAALVDTTTFSRNDFEDGIFGEQPEFDEGLLVEMVLSVDAGTADFEVTVVGTVLWDDLVETFAEELVDNDVQEDINFEAVDNDLVDSVVEETVVNEVEENINFEAVVEIESVTKFFEETLVWRGVLLSSCLVDDDLENTFVEEAVVNEVEETTIFEAVVRFESLTEFFGEMSVW